ncbi:B-box zinc finger protein 32-like [Castanea sativa]|uniref:B-box zinc finger protein 32-like n=1 Tax=Castanea sativa TaxID=21020 RepID=UPI003F652A58
MKKVRACELCREEASLYCASDSAFLCFRCDAKVHGANFLVARHVRQAVCFKCGGFSDRRISGAGDDRLRRYYCLPCSPEEELDSDYDSSASSSDCVSSSESCATGPKRAELEDRSEEEKKKKKKKVAKRSVSSSVTEISGGGGDDAVFPARFSVQKKRRKVVDEKAEGIFVNWCRKQGVNGNSVIPLATKALEFCLSKLTVLPFRVSVAASFWLGLRCCGDKSVSTCHNLRGLVEVSGVPAKLILATEIKLARALRVRKDKLARDNTSEDEEEGWAECSV